MKLIIWNKDQAKKELSKRLTAAKDVRRKFEYSWETNERTIYSPQNPGTTSGAVGGPIEGALSLGDEAVDAGSSNVSMNKIMKNVRFLHSQMSANPPTVLPRPSSSDQADRRSASSADRLVRHNIRQYDMPEVFDQSALSAIIYGTGIIKTCYNPDLGEVLDYDAEKNDVLMEGDIELKNPIIWSMWFDPDAENPATIKWCFEEINMAYEQATSLFPNNIDELEKVRDTGANRQGQDLNRSAFQKTRYDSVTIYEYWEKGLPQNGLVGRRIYCLDDGTVLGEIAPNPHRFKSAHGGAIKIASLPYHIVTDVDIPGQLYGGSIVSHAVPLQATLNQMDNTLLDAMEAHAVARLIIPDDGEMSEDTPTNSSFDIYKITGVPGFQPNFVEAMPWPDSFFKARESIVTMIDDIMGVNENMFGQQSREQSGFSMQYATNQGNMVRRRLFNKYVKQVESVHKAMILMAQEHWTDGRSIKVLGNENAFEVYDFKAADVKGGYDIVVEYGASLSLDPTTRREEIITLMPLFEKAGIPSRTLIGYLKLNELDNMHDRTQLASVRQREYFDEMVSENREIPPEEMEDHKYMLEFAYDYVMTAEFKYLSRQHKELIWAHMKAREQLAATGPAAQAATEAPAGGVSMAPGQAAPAPSPVQEEMGQGGGAPIVPQ